MKNIDKEILLIAQEECAEVTQAISKVFRFGMTEEFNGSTNKERLEEELGDLMCMVGLIMNSGLVDKESVKRAEVAKLTKLKQWSQIEGL